MELLPSTCRKRAIGHVATDPRQKRKVTRACDTCKTRKAKCSGTQPCDTCAQKELECLYQASYSRGKPPTPPSNLHVRTATCSETMHPICSPTMPVQDVPSRASPELEISGQYSDSTSGLSFLHRAWRRLSNDHNGQLANGTLETSENEQLLVSAGDKPFPHRLGRLQLPPLSKCRHLMAMYFDICIATYRILHRPTIESWLETMAQNAKQGSHIAQSITQAQASVVLAMLAVASFHEAKAQGSDPPLDDDEAMVQCDLLFSESVRLAETESGYPKLESAQARLIQVLYLLTSSRMNQAWYTFGHTLLIISALGLHRRGYRRRRSNHRNFIEDQCRKRTFWVAYTLDKYLGVVFGRPRHYHDDDIDQEFPDPINDEDMNANGIIREVTDDCHINSLICHAKLAQISEQILREVYSIRNIPDPDRVAASHRLGLKLREWKSSLPPVLGVINPSSLIPAFRRQATVLQLSYCHAVMLAHRPFLLKNVNHQTEDVRNLASESIEECISAAESVFLIVDRMKKDGRIFHAFWWTHYVTFCALVVVYVWSIQQGSRDQSANDTHANILDRAENCLNHLAQATACNSPSRRYSIILQELRSEAKRKAARRLQAQSRASITVQGQIGQDMTSNLSNVSNADAVQWGGLLHSPLESGSPRTTGFLDGWQTTDWLDLDSSAFGPIPLFDNESINWMSDIASN
ncbi:hypothetical protein DM02DRAFT_673779 [Periconia macrospinosa]|uniref:Zn(2)-C6 fungal-type domain-containing protein n=1 Tax=Periconia macrospinosa TaxID=97972 RepID=A0A2V1DKT7_9PLEO|nr:hypothetical protein DM02DRAFT_673779 [Periconia macrospinosa]